MDNFIPSASLFLGIIPALLFLLISVRGYEGFLKQKNIFLAFIGGIIIGFVAAVLEIYTGDVPIYIILAFPVFEQLFKTIILNIGRLQEKRETVIYGLTLGLGFGAVSTSASIIRGTIKAGDYLSLGLVIFGSFGIIMLQGATGVLIGFGVYKKELMKWVIFAILLQIIFNTGVIIIQRFSIYIIVTYLFVFGVIIYWYATKKIMPRILLESQRRKRTQKDIGIKAAK
jgi:RsiW-degrading membrane proteinase PrsW (M82 family)